MAELLPPCTFKALLAPLKPPTSTFKHPPTNPQTTLETSRYLFKPSNYPRILDLPRFS
ncbi:hypothetical protein PISMIDRAFT_19138 [Pisolithus microcarpus 441]|uniref:Uncharacterized protein n=1 Tax=Pisolithus microcarpus 441 TaxID=765257 RepID=A0A0C9YVI5_9AGAM|nr:hypothetical protein PISMIDRAFT_19138 [Pisolithus microcarpus 441]